MPTTAKKPLALRCHHCEETVKPRWKSRTSPIGWIFFAAMILLGLVELRALGAAALAILLVSLLGFAIRTHYRVCPRCSLRLGQAER